MFSFSQRTKKNLKCWLVPLFKLIVNDWFEKSVNVSSPTFDIFLENKILDIFLQLAQISLNKKLCLFFPKM